MKLHIRQLTRPLALLAFAATPALAGDFYVDAVTGSDTNGGTSELDAWRTLTHAVDVVPIYMGGGHLIHVAPGVYTSASGEVFPLIVKPTQRIVGTGGSAVTILEGPATSLLSFSYSDFHLTLREAAGLTLRNADRGIDLFKEDHNTSNSQFDFDDMVIEQIGGVGVRMYVRDTTAQGVRLAATFTRTRISECERGIDIDASSTHTVNHVLSMTDSVIRDCTSDGIRVQASYFATASVGLDRTHVVHNGGNGVSFTTHMVMNESGLSGVNSVFAHNQDAGIRVSASVWWLQQPGGIWPSTKTELRHCTIASNGVIGIAGSNWPSGPYGWLSHYSMSLWNCIVSGNGDDFWVSDPARVDSDVHGYSSDCADGYLLGQPGCIAADPAFVDPSNDDFRLAFASPCVDSADPAFASTTDLLGRTRSLDGDLDTIAVPDMGAIEFAPLSSTGFEAGSTRLLLELSGPDYGRSILYLSDAPLLMTPETTPFGSFFLVRSTAVEVPIARIQSRTSNLIELKVPAALVPGSTITLQALIRSHASPSGAAFSNPLEFVIAP